MKAMQWLVPQVQSLGDLIFFKSILGYLRHEIQTFGIDMLGRMMTWVGLIALTLLTLWILVQGFRIVTGQSRDSMAALVVNALKGTLILIVATSMAMFGSDLHDFLNKDVKNEINFIVTGEEDGPEHLIDKNLAWMQVALSSIDVLDVAGDEVMDDKKSRAMWMVGFGTGGPAIVGGTMLLLYEIALALFIGLGPLFILCLLFEQTKALFGRWLYYGIGTMFSMAVLAMMVSIALEMVARVASAFWATALTGALLGTNFTEGMTSQAMQQGGMGLILSILIVSAPPMAAAFFQGTLGHFSTYNSFGGGGQASGMVPAGSSGAPRYIPPQAANHDTSAPLMSSLPRVNASQDPILDAIRASSDQRRG